MALALREAYVTSEMTSQLNSCDSQLRQRIHHPGANPLNPKVHMYKSLGIALLAVLLLGVGIALLLAVAGLAVT